MKPERTTKETIVYGTIVDYTKLALSWSTSNMWILIMMSLPSDKISFGVNQYLCAIYRTTHFIVSFVKIISRISYWTNIWEHFAFSDKNMILLSIGVIFSYLNQYIYISGKHLSSNTIWSIDFLKYLYASKKHSCFYVDKTMSLWIRRYFPEH